MVYIRAKKIRGKAYYYVVEGKLDKNGKVMKKVFIYLGRVKHIMDVFRLYKKTHRD